MTRRLHPGLVLSAWGLLAVPLGSIDDRLLCGLLVFFALLHKALLWQTCRRMRWLLLAMVLSHAWAVPGQAVFMSDWSPSWQGLGQGAAAAAHLLWMVGSLRQCWLWLGHAGMMQSLSWILTPFAALGLPVDPFMSRLGLTLQFSEYWLKHPPRWKVGDWQRALAEPPPQTGQDEVKLLTLPWTSWDSAVLLLLVLMSFLLWNFG